MKELLHVTWKQFSICTQASCLQKHGHYNKAQSSRGSKMELGRQKLGIPIFKFFAEDRYECREKPQKMQGGEGGEGRVKEGQN